MSEHAEHLEPEDDLDDEEEVARHTDPLIGQTIDGRYEIIQRCGEGGMGVVYQAKHVVLGKPLAMKVLRADVSKDDEIITRFRQEAQSASAIGSPHIIDISDFGQLPDGSTYFVMEFLDGQELTSLIEDDEAISNQRAVKIAMQLCDALGAAHDAGIVHRDMKPDNVFLIRRMGDDDFVKVLDFGIAKVGGANSKLTKAGQVFGTPHYMSPEQCAGQAVDRRTDIYALGVILYEMVCGQVPFDADNLMGILTKHIYEQPIPPHTLPPPVNVDPGLEAVILKCLSKSTDTRYQTMAEVKADLAQVARGGTPDAVLDEVQRNTAGLKPSDVTGAHLLDVGVGGDAPEEPSRLPLVVGAAIGLLALVATGVLVYTYVLAPPEPDPVPIAQPDPEPPEPDPPVVPEDPPAGVQPEVDPEPPAPAAVMVTIHSEPESAEVYRVDDQGETLAGNTPFELEQPAAGQFVNLVLRQAGYEDHPVRVGHATRGEVHLNLRQARSSRRRSRQQTQETTPTQTEETTAPAEDPPPRRRGPGIGSEVLDPWGNPRD